MRVKHDNLVRQDQVSQIPGLADPTPENLGFAARKRPGARKGLSDDRGWLRWNQPHLPGASAVRERSRQQVPSTLEDSVSS